MGARSALLMAVIVVASCGRSSRPSASTSTPGGTGGSAAQGGASASGGSTTTGGASASPQGGDANAMGGSVSSGGTSGSAGVGGVSPSTSGRGGTDAAGGSADTVSGGGPNAGGEGGATEPEPPELAPPSCEGFSGDECAGHDCCESPLVPGGSALLDGEDTELPGFRLDRFEVTVARFRNFMAAQKAWADAGNPVQGAGAHPLVPESGYRRSWLEAIDPFIVAGLEPTWLMFKPGTAEAPNTSGLFLGNPTYPIAGTDAVAVNYVPMHVAFAFCIWDGGRLPAAVEWLYAFRRGEERTLYPWGDAPEPRELIPMIPSPVLTPYESDGFWQFIGVPVGSTPVAAGRFGQDDLATGFSEFFRDTNPLPPAPRQGGFIELADDENVTTFNRAMSEARWEARGASQVGRTDGLGRAIVGFRCARDLPR